MFSLCRGPTYAQGLETTAKKDDWEEINFEFDSAVLSDGYPSLLRLAELLSQNADYRVDCGATPTFAGPDQYNIALGRRRAETVRRLPGEVRRSRRARSPSKALGKAQPEVSNESDEGRFMNRRVVMQVTDGQGHMISDGGVGQAIQEHRKGHRLLR